MVTSLGDFDGDLVRGDTEAGKLEGSCGTGDTDIEGTVGLGPLPMVGLGPPLFPALTTRFSSVGLTLPILGLTTLSTDSRLAPWGRLVSLK